MGETCVKKFSCEVDIKCHQSWSVTLVFCTKLCTKLVFSLCSFSLFSAWRDSCFPEPHSCFLHETGLESLNIASARCFFYWNVKGKTRKKRKNTDSSVASLGAGVQPRSTVQLFMPVSGVEKPPFRSFFSRLWGVIWQGKAFLDQQCQFLTRNKSLSSENESNCSMTS